MTKKSNNLDLGFKIERSNQLNMLSPKGWSLTEVRFLAIYQAKINARNPESRVVMFPLETFCNIMEIKRINITKMKEIIRSLLCKPVFIPNDNNGFTGICLFSECDISQDKETNEWIVKIECQPKALSYMFEMKRNYFTYELWNALSLKSINQIRMYEILKQYEKIGNRIIGIDELKRLLGIGKNQYNSFKNFRIRVLESCQKALEQYTDIKFTFESIRRGRKIHALKFTITKNPKFKDDLKLKEFINPSDLSDVIEPQKAVEVVENMKNNVEITTNDVVNSVYLKCQKAYTIEQVQNLMNLAEMISSNPGAYIISIYYNITARDFKINDIYKYTLSVIQAELRNTSFSQPMNTQKKRETTYDLDEFEDFIRSTKRMIHE